MLTSTEIFKEYAACLQDPVYAIGAYLETFDKTQEGFVPFKLFDKQRDIIHSYETHRFNLVTKPRQAGISTTTQAYMAIKAAFADSKNPETILVIANKLKLANKFLKGIKDYIQQLPRWVWGEEYMNDPNKEVFIINAKSELELPNGSVIVAFATSTDALRGWTPTYLIFDEAAFIDNGEELYAAAISSLGTGGSCILISTPNGMDPLYHTTYEQAMSKDNDYNVIEMKWYQDPRYNRDLMWVKEVGGKTIEVKEVEFNYESFQKMIKGKYKPTSTWYRDMCKLMNNDARRIAQELDVSFLGSGGNVIADEYILFHEDNNVMDPKFIDSKYSDGNSGEVWIWEEPQEEHQYIMGVDVARGDGADSSTMVIIDFTTMEQVVEYKGKMLPDLLAGLVEEYGNMYKAYTVVDITGGMGVPTILKLMEIKYEYIHYDESSKVLNKKKDLEAHVKDGNKIPGFNVGSKRIPMISNMEMMIRTDGIKIRSRKMTSEMKTFIYKNGRPDHMEGKHDDLLMALGMALWVLNHSFKKLERLGKQTKAILGGWTTSSAVTDDASGFVPKALRKKTVKKPNFDAQTAKNMQDPNGDFLWLFSGMK